MLVVMNRFTKHKTSVAFIPTQVPASNADIPSGVVSGEENFLQRLAEKEAVAQNGETGASDCIYL